MAFPIRLRVAQSQQRRSGRTSEVAVTSQQMWLVIREEARRAQLFQTRLRSASASNSRRTFMSSSSLPDGGLKNMKPLAAEAADLLQPPKE